MKKYTVYEIEKLTQGRISKYKITKAIKDKELQAELIKDDNAKAKHLIADNELQKWLHLIGDQLDKKIILPNTQPINENNQEKENSLKQVLEEKDKRIEELKERIYLMENKNIPLLEESKKEAQQRIESINNQMKELQEKEEEKAKERRRLIIELSQLKFYHVQKRKEILGKLNEIS
ncbi:MAG: hypothetical protein WC860_06640 [Candidatus Margulisiibacteriota bacterium]|jgi:hypothetical protein